jgi:two-component system heavy metal sensor histidine kinase CusS
VEVSCEGEAIVDADPLLLRQAVSNLLSNALNNTPRGGKIHFAVAQRDDHTVEITVSDTGCGIAAEHLPKVFDRFYRVDPARSQHPNGSGLGLAIVKSIVSLHGGTIRVTSEVGKGSTFTLEFPAENAGENMTELLFRRQRSVSNGSLCFVRSP